MFVDVTADAMFHLGAWAIPLYLDGRDGEGRAIVSNRQLCGLGGTHASPECTCPHTSRSSASRLGRVTTRLWLSDFLVEEMPVDFSLHLFGAHLSCRHFWMRRRT